MRRVLVIDDHLPSRQSLTAASVEIGFSIVGEGTHGENAVELARATAPEPGVTCCG
jgi:DNA-binding NarL/FixJ family response regulator